MREMPALGRLIVGLVALSIVLAACGGTASPSPAPTDPSSDAPITAPPGGGDPIVPPDGAKVVNPRPGQLDVHDVPAETIAARVEGRKVVVSLTWWSGVEPCTILDTIIVAREESGFAFTLREGRGPEEVACIAIAEQHITFVDLGELEPGTYSFRDATGGAPAIEVTVS